MGVNIKSIQKQRKYSEDFKREIVSIFESGKSSVLQLTKLYGVPKQCIYNWIYRYSTFNEPGFRVVELKSSHMDKLKELQDKVKALEQMVGQKQIQIEFLEKMIDIAKTDFNIDIKKNFSTPRSTGSVKTGKK